MFYLRPCKTLASKYRGVQLTLGNARRPKLLRSRCGQCALDKVLSRGIVQFLGQMQRILQMLDDPATPFSFGFHGRLSLEHRKIEPLKLGCRIQIWLFRP